MTPPTDGPTEGAPAAEDGAAPVPPEPTGSRFPVTDLAVTSVHRALDGAAALWSARTGASPPAVGLDAGEVVHAVASERHLTVDGVTPPLWDPLAGAYRTADGWVRLHTNYAHHRAAALAALGLADREPAGPEPADRRDEHLRETAAARLATLRAVDVEDAVAAAGGAASALRAPRRWRATAQAAAVDAHPLVGRTPLLGPRTHVGTDAHAGHGALRDLRRCDPGDDPTRPCTGVRVLDLTRVIAGPTAGKVLAALGADVLRVDPPGFAEVPVLVADTTAGKRATALDLRADGDAATFASLVAAADVVLLGLRPGSAVSAGWSPARLGALRPGLVLGRLSAWGDTGPWGDRRGFDSLVQVATGLAWPASGQGPPEPLPAQVLDHASGWLLAAGVLEALTDSVTTEPAAGAVVDVVLARTAHELLDAPPPGGGGTSPGAARTEVVDSALGRISRVVAPGRLAGRPLTWGGPPVVLGSAPAVWL
ncbi:CoA transferase [Thalassiella azotivora]